MDTYSTMKPTNFLLKCFALNCICKKDNKITSSWSLIKNILILLILCSINSIIFYNRVQNIDLESNEFTFREGINYVFILGFLQYVINLVYVRKYGTKECVSYYYAYDEIDEILKMGYYNETKITCLKIMVLSCTFFIFNTVLDGLTWYSVLDKFNISDLIEYFYNFTTMLIILDMVPHIVQIEYRLRSLGDRVEKFKRSNKDDSKCITIHSGLHSEATGLYRLQTFNVKATENAIRKPDDILQLSQCYLMLIKQTGFINTMYGFRILLTCLNFIIHLINLCNIAIRVMFEMSGLGKLPLLSSILILLVICFNMYTLAHRCEKVYRQSDRIVEIIDDLIIYRKTGKQTILPLKELRELISSRAIQFHTSHVFRIDYTFLSAMTSVVVTYTIILLQNLKS